GPVAPGADEGARLPAGQTDRLRPGQHRPLLQSPYLRQNQRLQPNPSPVIGRPTVDDQDECRQDGTLSQLVLGSPENILNLHSGLENAGNAGNADTPTRRYLILCGCGSASLISRRSSAFSGVPGVSKLVADRLCGYVAAGRSGLGSRSR